jgi:alcohol oxidase
VEYVDDPITRPNADETVHVARASRLVVVSAGAFGTPAILERSGIGGDSILQRADVPLIIDLPGVGECYQGQKISSSYS